MFYCNNCNKILGGYDPTSDEFCPDCISRRVTEVHDSFSKSLTVLKEKNYMIENCTSGDSVNPFIELAFSLHIPANLIQNKPENFRRRVKPDGSVVLTKYFFSSDPKIIDEQILLAAGELEQWVEGLPELTIYLGEFTLTTSNDAEDLKQELNSKYAIESWIEPGIRCNFDTGEMVKEYKCIIETVFKSAELKQYQKILESIALQRGICFTDKVLTIDELPHSEYTIR